MNLETNYENERENKNEKEEEKEKEKENKNGTEDRGLRIENRESRIERVRTTPPSSPPPTLNVLLDL